MCVSPIAESFFSSDILSCDIISARISDFMVDNDDFSVISVVKLRCDDLQLRFKKISDFSTGLQVFAEDNIIDASAAERVH